MQEVINGILKFQRDVFPKRRALFRQLAAGQAPRTLFISCSDSRMVPELVTQCEPGELFVIRNAGNIVPPFGPEPGGIFASVEYAVVALGVVDIVVCGHSDCGAMKAIATCQCLDHMPAVAKWLQYADAARLIAHAGAAARPEEHLAAMARENVIAQLDHLRTHPAVALALMQGRLALHGWIYDIETGAIDTFDASHRRFAPLTLHGDAAAAVSTSL